jgi:transposase
MTKGRVEVITSVERRRRFSSAEKQQLVSASLEPGASVSAVAREAGIHPGQLYGWRRQLGVRARIMRAPHNAEEPGSCREEAAPGRRPPGRVLGVPRSPETHQFQRPLNFEQTTLIHSKASPAEHKTASRVIAATSPHSTARPNPEPCTAGPLRPRCRPEPFTLRAKPSALVRGVRQ